MGHALDENNGLGGLNFDDEARHIPKGDYVNARNIRNAINSVNRGKTVTNIKGNTLIAESCLPYNNNVFPTGRNKVIGSVEDTKYNTVIYFVWNSGGQHQILRYYRNETSPANPYGVVKQVIQYDFGWTNRTRINSANIIYGTQEAGADSELTGDLLYWCDKKPREINITKAELCGKKKCWDVYFPATTDEIPPTTTFYFKNFSGTTIFTKAVNTDGLVTQTGVTINFTTVFPFDQIEVIGYDLTGVTEITISGTTGNNRTFTVRSVEVSGLFVIQSRLTVNETVTSEAAFGAAISYTIGGNQRYDIIQSVVSAINSDSNSPVEAIGCNCSLEFCEKVAGTVWTIESDTDTNLISAKNWYGATLIERFFDRCKWPAMNAPQALFAKDTAYEPNYVQRKVFQFRLEYDYDNLERSSLGVWSQIPINNLGCDGTSDTSYNYIDINFNDSLIANAETLVVLKKIRFIARELNTGSDRAVIALEPCDFLDYINGQWVCHFKFYNDIISSPIDAALAAKLFDNVPLESNDERFVKNRLVEGGILEGYDAPECVNAKAQMEFGDTPNPTLYKVKFYVRVLTYGLSDGEQAGATFYDAFPSLKKYPFWNPYYTIVRGGIFHDTSRVDNDFAFYGGGGFGRGAGGDFGITTGMETTYDQRIPEGGFPVYLAGTKYFAISKQISVGLATDSDGALDTSTSEKKDAIGDYLYGTSNNGGDLYSEVTLMVPAGEYVARVASHWCSFGDKLEKGFMYDLSAGTSYQKTSTNVWGTVGANGFPLTTWNKTKEIKFTVTNSDINDAGTFVILDLTPPHDYDQDSAVCRWQPVSCYLYDDRGSTDVNSDSFIGVPVEKTVVSYETGIAGDWSGSAFTDHNGYWFGIQGANLTGYLPIKGYQVNTNFILNSTIVYVGSLSDLFSKTLSAENFALVAPTQVGTGTPVSLVSGVVVTTNTTGRDNCSTRITGHVVSSNGDDVGGVSVVYECGATATTRNDGIFSMIAWGDMVTVNIPNTLNPTSSVLTPNDNRVVDNLIYSALFACLPSYPNGQEQAPITIDPFGTAVGEYNPDFPYVPADFVVDENNEPAIKSLKRGGNYPHVGRLYDSAGRLCSCFPLFDLYIPFITEDIGKYRIEDFNNAVYPSGTYLYGKPTVKVVLDGNTRFPAWASFLQIMRPKNMIYGSYLQWVANEVTYVSQLQSGAIPEIQTTFQNGNATAIKISISNIIYYGAQNDNSQVSYTYQAGDRARLIADRDIGYINGLNDFEITSYDSTTQEIVIDPSGYSGELKSGMLFEIFNAKSIATQDEQIFYEVGEVIKINSGIPEVFSLVLTNGDTYWHGRQITVNDELTNFTGVYPVVVEASSPSDFYPSTAQDIGRIGIIDPAFKQVYAPTKVRASNVFLPSTAVNGLSSFEELNQKEFDRSDGQIERLVSINNTIVAVMNLREVSNYIGVVSFQQASDGEEVLAIANQYFGTDYPHTKTLGTNFPASVIYNDGQIFGFTSRRGNVWKYRGDGEFVISDVKMINYFHQLMTDGVSDAVAIYDRRHEEYILTVWKNAKMSGLVNKFQPRSGGYDIGIAISPLPPIDTSVTLTFLINGQYRIYDGEVVSSGGTTATVAIETEDVFTLPIFSAIGVTYGIPETVVWYNGSDETREFNKERWVRFDSRTPEDWCQIGSDIVSFKDGHLWIENTNTLYNNFYGVQYQSMIKPVFNEQNTITKVWNALWLSQIQANGGCNWRSDTITNEEGQLSRLNNNSWNSKEGVWRTDFKRDLTDLSRQHPILNGRRLRSCSLTVELNSNYTGEFILSWLKANWTPSERTTK